MNEPAQWADLVAHLRAQLAAAHREGWLQNVGIVKKKKDTAHG
jgi:hypothetical protein